MKRSLLPSFCALLLVGCGAADRKTTFAQNVETKGVATSTPPPIPAAPAPATHAAPLPVRPPQVPPELPAPVQEVVRLAQTTLSEGVLVDYIAVIQEPFSLGRPDGLVNDVWATLTVPKLEPLWLHVRALTPCHPVVKKWTRTNPLLGQRAATVVYLVLGPVHAML